MKRAMADDKWARRWKALRREIERHKGDIEHYTVLYVRQSRQDEMEWLIERMRQIVRETR